MDQVVVQRLLEINRRFYTDFGQQFSATRQRIQPGAGKIVSGLAGTERILDLGCGNGELARRLAGAGFKGTYLGLDFSLPLLKDARLQQGNFQISFRAGDLTTPGWEISLAPANFSLVTAFAVLHHIPGTALRQKILHTIHTLLAPGGKFILSNWQFLNSNRLKNRIQPWEAAGLSAADVDENDYLLDWRSGGSGLRYVHFFSPQELIHLAFETGFEVKETFFSDGESGRLGLYQIWERYEDKG